MTDAFAGLATAHARIHGRADLAMVVIPHPVGGLEPAELVTRIVDVVNVLVPRAEVVP